MVRIVHSSVLRAKAAAKRRAAAATTNSAENATEEYLGILTATPTVPVKKPAKRLRIRIPTKAGSRTVFPDDTPSPKPVSPSCSSSDGSPSSSEDFELSIPAIGAPIPDVDEKRSLSAWDKLMLRYVHDIKAQCCRSEGLEGHYHSFMKLLHDIDKKEEKKQDKMREMEEDMKMAEELGVPYEAILDEVEDSTEVYDLMLSILDLFYFSPTLAVGFNMFLEEPYWFEHHTKPRYFSVHIPDTDFKNYSKANYIRNEGFGVAVDFFSSVMYLTTPHNAFWKLMKSVTDSNRRQTLLKTIERGIAVLTNPFMLEVFNIFLPTNIRLEWRCNSHRWYPYVLVMHTSTGEAVSATSDDDSGGEENCTPQSSPTFKSIKCFLDVHTLIKGDRYDKFLNIMQKRRDKTINNVKAVELLPPCFSDSTASEAVKEKIVARIQAILPSEVVVIKHPHAP